MNIIEAMDINEAIKLLQKTVKESAVPGQKHIDFTLVPVSEQKKYQDALVAVHKAIFDQQLTREQFERQVGLI